MTNTSGSSNAGQCDDLIAAHRNSGPLASAILLSLVIEQTQISFKPNIMGLRHWAESCNPFWANFLMREARGGSLTARKAAQEIDVHPDAHRMSEFDTQLREFVRVRVQRGGGRTSGHALSFLWLMLMKFNPSQSLALTLLAFVFIATRVAYQLCFAQFMAVLAADPSSLVFTVGGGLPPMGLSLGLFCLTCVGSSFAGYLFEQ